MKQKILVELDALLDTRLGTLSLLYPDATATLLNETYTKRLSDEFHLLHKDINTATYRERYKNRDVEVLMCSAPTWLSFALDMIVRDMERAHHCDSPEIEGISIDINVYPYELDEEYRNEFMVAISARCGIEQTVNIVSIPHTKLTFEYIITQEWSTLFMYNFQEWMEAIGGLYKEKPAATPSTSIISPALLKCIEEAKDVRKRTLPDGRVLDPFETLSACFADIIGLVFIPVEHMSLYLSSEDIKL